MGYISSSTTMTVTARLTPYGRKKLLSTSNVDFVSYFSLGDSDANYQTIKTLSGGEVPGDGGNLNYYSGSTNSVTNNISVRNKLIYNSVGDLYKPVGSGSFDVIESVGYLGLTTISGNTLEQNIVNKSNYTTDSLVNLFNTFGLPLKNTDINKYNTLNINGGYLDTAISGLVNTNILVIAIPNSQYGEIIDGKTIKLDITTSAATYTCYGTYQRNYTSYITQDTNIRETSSDITPTIGDNITLLFSDVIKRPNGTITNSWATGYDATKPFSLGNKSLFNYTTSVSQGYTADTSVGVAYLDKGFIVITQPEIVNSFVEGIDSTATTISFNSIVTDISQSIVCDAQTSEFRKSTNPTFTYGVDTPKLTEIGLYDKDKMLVAIAKLSEAHLLNNMYFRVEVKITV
jgi:hypothetical protein